MGRFKNANTASAVYCAAKKKLLSLGGASTSAKTPTPKPTPKKAKANGAAYAAETPTTPTPTAKKPKAKMPKSAVKAEETTVKSEEATGTNAAGDADNEESATPTLGSTSTPTKKRVRGANKPKDDENGNVIPPKKRATEAAKAAQATAEETAQVAAAAAEAQKQREQQDQVEVSSIVHRILQAQANGMGSTDAAYAEAVSDAEILQENDEDVDLAVQVEEVDEGQGEREMTQDEKDEKMFNKFVTPDLVNAEEA